ncbi:uncharacterized protein ACJ7VT_000156 [Polymixia lowei]
MATRRRSVVWTFFKILNEKRAQCMLCLASVIHHDHTTNLLRHLRVKHPIEFSSAESSDRHGAEMSDNDNKLMINSDQYYQVEVAVDDDNSETVATVNEADITIAINGLLEADQVELRQREAKEKGGGPSSARQWSSIWTHYKRLENQKAALCLLCKEKIQHHSNTSNLHRHLSNKHPEAFAQLGGIRKKRPSNMVQRSSDKDDSSKPSRTLGFKDKISVTEASEGEARLLERERELINALRNAQKQEAQALEQQRELLEMLRRANAREAAAERENVESLRRTLEEESKALCRQREELQKERADLDMKRERLQQEKEELQCRCRTQSAN